MRQPETSLNCGTEPTPTIPAPILLVDKHPLVRQAIKHVLAHEADLRVCGEAGDAATAMELLGTMRPSLVLLDTSLVPTRGIDLLEAMFRAVPGVRVLVLAMDDQSIHLQRALRGGAHGYINKRTDAGSIVAAIRSVLLGGSYKSKNMS